MTDPIRFVKSSGGDINSEFTGADSVARAVVDVLRTFPSHKNILINKNNALTQYRLDVWRLTDLIPVLGDSVVACGSFGKISDNTIYEHNLAFYDLHNKIIGGATLGDDTVYDRVVTVPSGTVYMRVQYAARDDNEMDRVPRLYAKVDWSRFCNKVSRSLDFDPFQLLVTPEDSSFITRTSRNMLNPEYIFEKGHFIAYGTGTYLAGDETAWNTRLIPIEPGEMYTLNKASQVVFFDDHTRFIGGLSNSRDEVRVSGAFHKDLVISSGGRPGSYITFTAPDSARYLSATIFSQYGNVQLEKGASVTAFTPYSVAFNCAVSGSGGNSGDSSNAKRNVEDIIVPAVLGKKTIKLIGDSITAGVGGTGYNPNKDGGGKLLWDGVYTNVQGVCWANMLKDYWEKKYGCTVLNYGYSGIASKHIIDRIDTLVENTDDVVVCMIGTNDRNGSQNSDLNGYMSKLDQIVRLIRSKGKDLVLMANIPASVDNEVNTPRVFHMEDVDNAVSCVAARNGMEYISVYKLFVEYCKYTETDIDSLLKDGLHPNDDGYGVMFELISNALGIATKRPGATW